MVRMPEKEKLCGYGKLQPGMEILATKWIALLGTAYLAKAYKRQLRQHFPTPFVNKAISLSAEAAVLPAAMLAAGIHTGADGQTAADRRTVSDRQTDADGQTAADRQTVPDRQTDADRQTAAERQTVPDCRTDAACQTDAVAMYEAAEGGIYAALWRMAEESGVGLEIQLRQIPIRQETVEICEFLDINPYQLLSGGCLLVGTYHAEELLRRFEKEEIPAVRIGHATGGNDRVLLDDGQVRYLERPQPDAFFRGLTQITQMPHQVDAVSWQSEKKSNQAEAAAGQMEKESNRAEVADGQTETENCQE